MEELCLDVCFVTDLEFRWQHAPAIGILLIVCLGVLNICLEGIVEFSEIDSELPSTAGSHVAFWVHFNGWMISLVGEEWYLTGCFVRRVVIREFGDQEERGPVILLIIAITT